MTTTPTEHALPPLTRWQTVWRNGVAIAVGAALWAGIAGPQWRESRWLLVADLSLGVVALVLCQFRRRWPLAIALLTTLTSAVSASSTGAWLLAAISLATRRRWTEIVPVGLASVGSGLVFFAIQPKQEPWYVNFTFGVAVTFAALAIGMYVGARRELVATLEDRAERAEREQALQVATAKAHERTRIAREMHDVLAHRMSLVAVHAGALAFRKDLTAEETRETAGIIQNNSHRALMDLREILGVLRDAEKGVDSTSHRPQPTLGDLECLLADERAAGARVDLSSEVDDLSELPDSIGRSAYRIIQEGLTNARKHSPNTTVFVTLSGAPSSGLTLEVRNPMRVGNRRVDTTGAGFGLIGLAERAAASRGRFEHGHTANGDFIVKAWLPWQV